MRTYHVIEMDGKRSLVAQKSGQPSDRLYWFGGISYMCMGDRVTIIHTFDPTDDYDREDEIEIAFWHDWNPPAAGDVAKHGWLSPDGIFYPCRYGEHDSAAKQIAASKYNTLESTQYLETQKWLRVQDGNVVWSGNEQPPATQPQLDKLWDISELPDLDDTKRRWAKRYIENVEVIE